MTFTTTSAPAETTNVQTLLAMLKTMRPHNSTGEGEFIRRFLEPLGVASDRFGNRFLVIGDTPTILWSSHIDSCHRRPGTQAISGAHGIIRLNDPASNCLGADCAAGVWLMTEMIAHGIPGLYVFHRGEERGGLGSAHIAQEEAHLLAGIKAAVAFDRKGTQSIITHQRGGRSCSDAFAASLAAAIGLGHSADPTGTFTDTANYTDLIGECSNISVGYDHEHTPHESLDVSYLLQLRNAMLAADFSRLVFQRQPGEIEVPVYDHLSGDAWGTNTWSSQSQPSLVDLVMNYPEAAADILESFGVTVAEFEQVLFGEYPY